MLLPVISTENGAKAKWEWRNPLIARYYETTHDSTMAGAQCTPLQLADITMAQLAQGSECSPCHSERRLALSVAVEESP